MIINDYDYYGDDEYDGNDIIFMLVTDNNDNWYVINKNDKDDFDEWVELMHISDNYSEFSFDDCRVDPYSLRFASYWEE